MNLETWAFFALAITFASFSPGPNVLIVMVNAAKHGLRGAAITIFGNLCTLFCVALLAAIGVGALLKTMPIAFTAMKVAGGLYLVWMGYKIIRNSFASVDEIAVSNEQELEGVSFTELFVQAVLVSASNPKSIIFLSAIFPQFLSPQIAIAPQFAIMFLTIIVLVGCIHGFYSLLALRARNAKISIRMRRWMARMTGTTFIGIGSSLAISR